jgi:SAM-dependent methyltransferase
MPYQIREISLGDLSRLYRYKQQNVFGASYSVKGFDYPWLLTSREWKGNEKVLDVGAAYSELPMHIQKTCGCETWVADDFGIDVDDQFWQRNKSPKEHIAKNSNVHFVTERVGIDNSSLPDGYFDVVYSLSALEHVPPASMQKVLHHMDRLLKPGGEMIHAVDILFPSNRGLWKVLAAILFDEFYWLAPRSMRLQHCLSTPRSFVRFVSKTWGLKPVLDKNLSVLRMVLDPEVMTEGVESGLNRIVKDGLKDFRYQRCGTLLFHLQKVG